jgi:hypothetical protein
VWRSQIVLLAGEGMGAVEVATRVGKSVLTVRRWRRRYAAKARAGIAPSSVHKIRVAHGLKPHLTKTFKLSRDPNFVAKVEDIVGLYINPPDKALVLAVDEKSQIGCDSK